MSESTHILYYGHQQLVIRVPGGRYLDTLEIRETPPVKDCATELLKGLAAPIGLNGFALDGFGKYDTVAIVVSDSFRDTRVNAYLNTLLTALNDKGIPSKQISIIFSTGTHRPPTDGEAKQILGDGIFNGYRDRIFSHDPNDANNLIEIGVTSAGTRVVVNKHVQTADHIILTGSVVMHYFGGFGGGRKSFVPGLASTETIAQNHSLNLDPDVDTLDPRVDIGTLKGNPVADDMLEATRLSHVDFIINTVLDAHSEVAGLFVGELEAAHEKAADFARGLFECPIDEKADLVIAGSPSTKNFVQTHKSLFNAYQAVKPEGRIILLATCPEGLGGNNFEKWLHLGDRAQIIAALRQQSEINGQTALSTREKAPITYLVSSLSDEDVSLIGAQKARTLDDAIERALSDLQSAGIEEPSYRIMPSAAYTVPIHAD